MTCEGYRERDPRYLPGVKGVAPCMCRDTFITTDIGCECEVGMMLVGEECVDCEIGKYKEAVGMHSCDVCEHVVPGTITAGIRSDSIDDCICPKGHYLNATNIEHARCLKVTTVGIQMTVDGMRVDSLSIEPGYWRYSNESLDFRLCPIKAACRGGSDPLNYCREGHFGVYCTECIEGYSNMQGEGLCGSCKESVFKSIGKATTVTLLFMVFIALCYIFRKVTKGFTRSRILEKFSLEMSNLYYMVRHESKILLVAYQIVVLLPQALPRMYYPANIENIFNLLKPLSFNTFQFVRFGCLFDNFDFYDSLLVQTLFPIVLFLFFIFLGMARGGREKHAMFNWALFVSYAVLPSVSQSIFDVFRCEKFGEGEDSAFLLRADFSIHCYTKTYYKFFAYGACMILIYPFGVPLLYTWILVARRKKLKQNVEDRDEDVSLKGIEFLFSSYTPEMWWFDIYLTYSRLVLTSLLCVIEPGSYVQYFAGITFAAVTMILVSYWSPYTQVHWNLLSVVANAEIFLLLTASVYLKAINIIAPELLTKQERSNWEWAVMVMGRLILAMNVITSLVFFSWAAVKVHMSLYHPKITENLHVMARRQSVVRTVSIVGHFASSLKREKTKRTTIVKSTVGSLGSSPGAPIHPVIDLEKRGSTTETLVTTTNLIAAKANLGTEEDSNNINRGLGFETMRYQKAYQQQQQQQQH